jgi:transcriptional regulator with XRE-family HTH domain
MRLWRRKMGFEIKVTTGAEDPVIEVLRRLSEQVMTPEPLPPVADVNRMIGWRLRQIRRAAGLTQDELAKALSGTPAMPTAWRHPQTVGVAERGERQFTVEDLIGVSAFFSVPMGFFIRPEEAGSHSQVGLGKTRVNARDLGALLEWLSPRGDEEIAPEPAKRVPLGLLKRVAGETRNRPWARYLRRGLSLAEAYRLAREEHLADPSRNRRLPGPTATIQGDVELELKVPVAPWGGAALILIRGGEPYTARDDIEADFLRFLIDRGVARRARPRQVSKTKGGINS